MCKKKISLFVPSCRSRIYRCRVEEKAFNFSRDEKSAVRCPTRQITDLQSYIKKIATYTFRQQPWKWNSLNRLTRWILRVKTELDLLFTSLTKSRRSAAMINKQRGRRSDKMQRQKIVILQCSSAICRLIPHVECNAMTKVSHNNNGMMSTLKKKWSRELKWKMKVSSIEIKSKLWNRLLPRLLLNSILAILRRSIYTIYDLARNRMNIEKLTFKANREIQTNWHPEAVKINFFRSIRFSFFHIHTVVWRAATPSSSSGSGSESQSRKKYNLLV